MFLAAILPSTSLIRSFINVPLTTDEPSVVIYIFKPKSPAVQLPTSLSEPLHPTTSSSAPIPSAHHHSHHPAAFDLVFARVSLLIEFVCYTLMPLAQTGLTFGAFSIVGAFGGGFGPAIQNVALTLYKDRGGRETGKLFGAMSVVQAMWCVYPLAPSIFIIES